MTRSWIAVALVACVRSPDLPTPPPAPIVSLPASTSPPPPPLPAPQMDPVERGNATWYGARLAGHRTASGERFDPSKLTAAHRTLPIGTWVEVTRVGTDRVVRVRINDRGPFGTPDKIIDLSRAAFERLGKIREGVIPVAVRVVSGP